MGTVQKAGYTFSLTLTLTLTLPSTNAAQPFLVDCCRHFHEEMNKSWIQCSSGWLELFFVCKYYLMATRVCRQGSQPC
jgi:hypothetical protein